MEKAKYFLFGFMFALLLFLFISAANNTGENMRYQISCTGNIICVCDTRTGVVKSVTEMAKINAKMFQLGKTFEEMEDY